MLVLKLQQEHKKGEVTTLTTPPLATILATIEIQET
jgi:hypothetical protein